jgi:hypothetical protein
MVSAAQDCSITLEHRGNRSISRPQGHSPPRWVGRCGRTEQRRSEVIVERIVERAVPVGSFLVLTKLNYYD